MHDRTHQLHQSHLSDDVRPSTGARSDLGSKNFETESDLAERDSLFTNLDDSYLSPPAAVGVVSVGNQVWESEREAAYDLELLHMARQRLHLLSSLTLLILPCFALLHALLSPLTRHEVGLIHAILLMACLLMRLMSRQLKTLFEARLLGATVYVLYAAGAAVIGVLISRFDVNAPLVNQLIVYNSFSPVLLSVLLLPVAVWECAAVTAVVLLAMSWLAMWSSPSGYETFFLSHLFGTMVSSFVVMLLAHYGHLQRRGAFNAAFDARRTTAQFDHLSSLDAVTGGYNRRHLERVLNKEIHRATRFGHQLSMAMFDLDNFKAVNDSLGHACGDLVLAQVQQLAQLCVRDVDTVARFGGDEFGVILPETNYEAALAIAERLQHDLPLQLAAHFGPDHPAARVTLSIGLVTASPHEITDAFSLLSRADDRLYEAKRNGKNRVCA